jgi:hypothetical protein
MSHMTKKTKTKRIPTTVLSPEQATAFHNYIKADRHRLGQKSYKSDVRIAREVLGSSSPEYADLIRRLMRKYYRYKRQDMMKWRYRIRSKRLVKPEKATRTYWRHWNPLDHGFYEYDVQRRCYIYIPFEGKLTLWFDKIANPKVLGFIEYVRAGNHINGIKVKSYPTIGRELGMSANTVRRWLKWLFPTIALRKERQER